VVVSEMGKGRARLDQVCVEETNASEPLMTCRKRRDDVKTAGGRYCGISSGDGLRMDGAASGMKVA
jgi:hypothetical protein